MATRIRRQTTDFSEMKSSSGPSLPIVSLGILAAGVGLYFVLRKPSAPAVSASAITPIRSAAPAADPLLSVKNPIPLSPPPSAFVAAQAQEDQDQGLVDALFDQIQDQVPSEVAPVAEIFAAALPSQLPKIPGIRF